MPKKDRKEEWAKVNEFLKKFPKAEPTRGVKATEGESEPIFQYKMINVYIDNNESFIVDPINYEPYIGYSSASITEEMISDAVDRICADYGLNKQIVTLPDPDSGEMTEVYLLTTEGLLVSTLREIYPEWDCVNITWSDQVGNVALVPVTIPVISMTNGKYDIGIYTGEA